MNKLCLSTLFVLLLAISASPQNTQVTPNNQTPLPEMEDSEKLKYGLKGAFLSPSGYAFNGLSAAITQWNEETQPHKTTEDEFADFLSRFAIKNGTRMTKSILGSGVYPVLFNQNPEYIPSGKQGFGKRALYAVSRVFITQGDNGNTQPNVSRLAGIATASALANTWERSTPGHDRIGVGPTFKRMGSSIAFDMARFTIFREFWPDIRKRFFGK
jgi:hypothetical protein